jgi:DNA-binding NarL/FixJ family response regulator
VSDRSPGLRVVVIEDEALVADFIVSVLEDTPHEVVGVAETGAEALRLAEAVRPDLALVDITLRGPMDGLELVQRLRERMPDLRVVFATGSHDPATRAKADALRPEGFLKKPFMPEHLVDVLDSVTGGLDRR